MSGILLKSFFGEVFLSFSILLQLVLNIRIINDKKLNFPEITVETFFQCFSILFISLSLINKCEIEGSFYGSFLVNNESTKVLKILLLFLIIVTLPIFYKSFKFQRINFFEYNNLVLLSIIALLLMISSENLLSFYILMEMQALCYYVLASFKRNSAFSAEAGLKYFVAGSFISGFYLMGTSLIYCVLGTINLNELYTLIIISLESYDYLCLSVVQIGILLIIGTLLFKVAAFPFHFWAPDVYEGAPITSSFIFSVFPKLSLYTFLIKIIHFLVIPDTGSMYLILNVLLIFGCISTIYGTFLALHQKRIKRLIIYSSIAQTGFLLSALSVGNLSGISDLYFFLIIYLITSILLWGYFIFFYEGYSACANYFNVEIKPLYLTSLENLYKYNGIFVFPLIIILFSIAGIPPLSGFLIKVLILQDLIQEDFICYAIFLLFVSALSVYYYIRIIKIVYFEPKKAFSSSFFFFQQDDLSTDISLLFVSILTISLVYFFFYPTSLILVCKYIGTL